MLHDARANGSGRRRGPRVHAEIADCVACGATTVLVPTAASDGRQRLPLDPEPEAKGAFVVRGGRVHVFRPGLHKADEARYASHFTKCPLTARFRR